MLTLATTIPSMKPPPCSDSRSQQCVEASGRQLALLYIALYTVALGGGGIKSNVSGFGSDQFDPSNPKEEKAMVYFFNRFYFCISLGSLFTVTLLVYVQDNVGRGWGYGISAGTMMIAVSVLLSGTPLYRFRKLQGSPLTVIWRVLVLTWKKMSLSYPSHPSLLNEYQGAKVPHTERCLDKAAILDEKAASNRSKPWIVSTMTQVEEVKMVLSLMSIWSSCIPFWTIYSQMTTFTIEQATFMNRNIGSFVVPAGSFSVFLFINVLLLTSLNERLFIPIARKVTHNPKGLKSLQRIGIGLLFSVGGMIAAAIVEKQRREHANQHNTRIRAFWLIPQFFFIAGGEAFGVVGMLEFFITEAPERMKSMSTGLFLSTMAMGYFLSSLLVSLVDKATNRSWLRSNLNNGKLENFYWMFAVLGVLNFLVFLAFAMRHRYKVQQYNGHTEGGQEELKNGNDEKLEDERKMVTEGSLEP
ncbi:hypothetical protein RJ639_045686 [Escallonia herrerae]|uniref:Uncharacterized protein n=1 Tax=Escallonia herrerae TaxID=1293975 RepID=A0AA88W8T6_9ASTE|nr:hypothetical protein RJ639_045686 [Escallonia herrerae]